MRGIGQSRKPMRIYSVDGCATEIAMPAGGCPALSPEQALACLRQTPVMRLVRRLTIVTFDVAMAFTRPRSSPAPLWRRRPRP